MKYIITESQLDFTMLRYLDMLGFKKVVRKKIIGGIDVPVIYFTTDVESGNSDIAFYGGNKNLFITVELCENIMTFFSLEELVDCELIVKRWVEDKLNREINVENIHIYGRESMFGDITFKFKEE